MVFFDEEKKIEVEGVVRCRVFLQGVKERIGFSDKVGLGAGGKLDRCDERSCGRDNPVFARVGQIRVGTDQFRSVPHEMDGAFQPVIAVISRLAYYNKIGIGVVYGKAGVRKLW